MPTVTGREFDILIELTGSEEKFGFSVAGGADKGHSPKINKIAADSPATRSKLQSGDELLAINGKNVQQATFPDIVALVQKSSKNRYVRLTIKRYDETQNTNSLPRQPPRRTQNNATGQKLVGHPRETPNGTDNGRQIIGQQARRAAPTTEDKEFLKNFRRENVDDRYKDYNHAQSFEGFDEDFSRQNAGNGGIQPSKVTPQNHDQVLDDLFDGLEHLKNTVADEKDRQDLEFLQRYCRGKEFQKAIKTHLAIADRCNLPTEHAISNKAQQIADEVCNTISGEDGPISTLLKTVLKLPHMRNLLYSHDKIASREKPTESPPVSANNDDYCYRLVEITKSSFPLGATIRRYGEKVVVNRIAKGGAADRCGLMSEGDEVVQVNGLDVTGKTVAEVVEIVNSHDLKVSFLTLPGDNTKTAAKDSHTFVKTYFDYNPIEDMYNPYRELGLKFQYGDILRVVPQEDGNWWQAQMIFSSHQNVANKCTSGIIPSKRLQLQRQTLSSGPSTSDEGSASPTRSSSKKKWFKISGKSKKKKSNDLSLPGNGETDSMLAPVYEEVREMPPTFNRTRPLVLVGAKYVGRNELKHRLLKSQPDRFAAAVECTTRTPRPNEVDGVDFHFMTRQEFEAKKTNHEMLEYRESNGQLYGLDIASVKTVMNMSKTCVLLLEPQMLQYIKHPELRPFVIFIRAPHLSEIGRTSRGNYDCSNFSVKMKNEAVRDMVIASQEIETKFKHFFDVILVNSDMVKLASEVQQIVESLTSAPQWVPSTWMH